LGQEINTEIFMITLGCLVVQQSRVLYFKGDAMKKHEKAVETLITICSLIIIFWLVLSTIDVNRHNMSDHKYAKWNAWIVLIGDENESPNDISQPVVVKGAPRKTTIKSIDSPFIFLGNFMLTSYCGCVSCCEKSDCITATGTYATEGRTIAVDPSIIPYGTEVIIDGQTFIAEDCGGAVVGNHIDVHVGYDNPEEIIGNNYHKVYIYKNKGD
jgi:3D (Asp-Asp-Asp) domain-containing protein